MAPPSDQGMRTLLPVSRHLVINDTSESEYAYLTQSHQLVARVLYARTPEFLSVVTVILVTHCIATCSVGNLRVHA